MKTLKSISLFALLLCAVLNLASCTKEEVKEETQSMAPALSASLDYELIGQQHNAILTTLGNDPAFSAAFVTGVPNPAALKITTLTEQETGCNSNCHQGAMTQEMLNTLGLLTTVEDVADLGDHALAQGRINATDHAAFYALNAILATAKTTSQSVFHQDLRNFENTVKTQQGLSANGRQALLAGSVVMRYSDTFWQSVRAAGPNNPWYAIDQARITPAAVPWYVRDMMGAMEVLLNPWSWTLTPIGTAALAVGVAVVASSFR